MKRSVKELETDLKNFRPHSPEDRFAEVMTVSFFLDSAICIKMSGITLPEDVFLLQFKKLPQCFVLYF